jgi:hypothetical protein
VEEIKYMLGYKAFVKNAVSWRTEIKISRADEHWSDLVQNKAH